MVAFWSVSDGGILVGFYWKQILVALKELVGQVEQNLVGLDGVDPKLVGPKEVESIQSCKEVESIQSCMEAGRSGARLVGFWLVIMEQGSGRFWQDRFLKKYVFGYDSGTNQKGLKKIFFGGKPPEP